MGDRDKDPDVAAGSRLVSEEDGDHKRAGNLSRVMSDEVYRRRLVATASVYWSFVVQGVSMGQFGPSFPDIRQIINEDLETASWLVTSTFFGYLLGSLISGILYDKYNRVLLLIVSLLGMAVTTAALPWCPYFWLMSVMRVLFGIFLGGLETGANSVTVSIWGEDCGPYMQALHFTYSVGGILGPFITEPFLSRKLINSPVNTEQLNLITASISGNETDVTELSIKNQYSPSIDSSLPMVITNATNIAYTVNATISNDSQNGSGVVFETPTYTDSSVHIAYFITSILILTAVVPFVLMCTQTPYRLVFKRRKRDPDQKQGRNITFKIKILCLCILSLIMLTYCSIEDNFTSYLMTFVISSQQWTKRDGSFATSLYWTSFCVGRFSGIFFIRCAKVSVILVIFLTAMPVSFMGLLIGATLHINPLLWIGFFFTAYSSSVIYATVFTWTEERIVPVSGKISALLQISGSTGSMITPLMLGYLMETYSPLWYIYLCLGLSLTCVLLFIVILIIVRIFVADNSSDLELDLDDIEVKADDYKGHTE